MEVVRDVDRCRWPLHLQLRHGVQYRARPAAAGRRRAALVALLGAFFNRDYRPRGEHARLSVSPGAPPGTSVSCGGTDPMRWLVTGLIIGGLAVLGYGLLRRRDRGEWAESDIAQDHVVAAEPLESPIRCDLRGHGIGREEAE